MMIVADEFLPSDEFAKLRELCDSAEFASVIHSFDQREYREVWAPLPLRIRAWIGAGLRRYCGDIDATYMFIRRYPAGVTGLSYPHQDWPQAENSLVLYLNRQEHCQGGTAFEGENEVRMQPNRAVLFDARKVHWSTPENGFGSTNYDARMVLVAFFNRRA